MEDLNKNFVILGDFFIKVANIRYIKFNVKRRTIQVCLMSNKKVKFKFECYDHYRIAEERLVDSLPFASVKWTDNRFII